ncbi:lysophospholipid acyltransferase family protein [Labrys sp. KNU-23]|uniref:lysophospholipid acyltransferase family protein n=1 Tax=Labrys sp. KNU-23 TaxID=2789216 RepID=UPI001FF026E5|nr:lysophospholipid acyltransferase family protein [Labrys sp. KNU-23]
MIKNIGRSRFVQKAIGEGLAAWLKLVHGTSRFADSPADLYGPIRDQYPYIVAMWHGQHFLVPFMRREGHEFRILISRHGDGEINAVAVTRLGLGLVRGSGGKPQRQHHKGGPAALRELVATLKDGQSVGVTADVPRTGGIAGLGIVTLARLSGRPIVPVAVATSNMIQLSTWDKAVINMPFSRGAFVVGDLVHVPGDADKALMEAKRLEVEKALDAAHHTAYAMVGRTFVKAGT